MRLAVLIVLAAASVAHSQPAFTQPYLPTPIEAADREALADGYVSTPQIVIGAGAAVFLGFGIGQTIEGRWLKTGWIMTVGETASLITFIGAVAPSFGDCFENCQRTSHSRAVLGIGALAVFGGLRIWEVVDSIAGPTRQNQRYLAARDRHPDFYVNPTPLGDGATVGLAMKF